jgi:hypothetical protein
MSDVHLIPGVWHFVKQLKRDGHEDPNVKCPATYTFSVDGKVVIRFDNGGVIQMRWKIVDDKLRMYMPHPLTGRSTHPFKFPDTDTLVLFDAYRRQMIFRREPLPTENRSPN